MVGTLPKRDWKQKNIPPHPQHTKITPTVNTPYTRELTFTSLSAHKVDCNPGGGEAGGDLGLLKAQRTKAPLKKRQNPSQLFKFPPRELQQKTFRKRKVCKFLLKRQLKKGPPNDNKHQHLVRDYLFITLDSCESICQSLSSLHLSLWEDHISSAESYSCVFLLCHRFRVPAAYPPKI